MSENPVRRKFSRHIDVCRYFVRELVKAGFVKLIPLRTLMWHIVTNDASDLMWHIVTHWHVSHVANVHIVTNDASDIMWHIVTHWHVSHVANVTHCHEAHIRWSPMPLPSHCLHSHSSATDTLWWANPLLLWSFCTPNVFILPFKFIYFLVISPDSYFFGLPNAFYKFPHCAWGRAIHHPSTT